MSDEIWIRGLVEDVLLAIHDTILLFPYGNAAGSTIDKSITKSVYEGCLGSHAKQAKI
jgi:hypothetical protein